MDLNVDCMRLIFEELDRFALISMAAANEDFLIVVQDVLRQKFPKKNINICWPIQ